MGEGAPRNKEGTAENGEELMKQYRNAVRKILTVAGGFERYSTGEEMIQVGREVRQAYQQKEKIEIELGLSDKVKDGILREVFKDLEKQQKVKKEGKPKKK